MNWIKGLKSGNSETTLNKLIFNFNLTGKRIGFDRFDYQDFENLCKLRDIQVIRAPSRFKALYLIRKGFYVIYLNSNLEGFEKTFVAFHELTHHFQGESFSFYSTPNYFSKPDYQANTMACFATMPTRDIQGYSRKQLIQSYTVAEEIIDFRLMLFNEYLI